MQNQYSLRSPAVKRLMKEAQELREPTAQYHAQPLEDNLFEWHFTIRGPDETDFCDGIYHGRIILPPDYPMKPPSIIILTPNGRFEVNTKICLSISGHHPESWQPSWSIRTALLAIIGFMPTHGGGAIGSLDYTQDEKKKLALRSLEWKCPNCGSIKNILRPVSETSQADSEEAKELASQINFQAEKKKDDTPKTPLVGQDSLDSTNTDSTTFSDVDSSTSSPARSPPFPSGQTPPWPGQWPGFPAAPHSRFPFMPFLPRTATMAGSRVIPTSTSAPYAQSFMPFTQMAAMHAAMQQHMAGRGGAHMRFPMWPPTGMQGFQVPGQQQTADVAGSPPASSQSSDSTGETKSSQNSPTAESSTGTSAESSASATSSSQSEKSAPVTSSASHSEPAPTATKSTTSTQSVSTSSSPSPSSPTVGASSDGLRQRTGASTTSSSPSPARVTTTSQPAELPRRLRQPQSSSRLTTFVMIILCLAIFILLLRRLSMMGIIHFYQEEEI